MEHNYHLHGHMYHYGATGGDSSQVDKSPVSVTIHTEMFSIVTEVSWPLPGRRVESRDCGLIHQWGLVIGVESHKS